MAMTRQEVVQVARERLDKLRLPWRFQVLEDAVRQDEDWWYVPVTAEAKNGQSAPREALVNAYANVEEDIQEQDHTNVLFVPANL